jgi:hypothetical protein
MFLSTFKIASEAVEEVEAEGEVGAIEVVVLLIFS